MSLKDYYIEKTAAESDPLKGRDGWATKYINIGRARSILEAFDDDGSGFVTVNEVNKLTQSRPRDWRYAFSSRAYGAYSFTLITAFLTGLRTGQ